MKELPKTGGSPQLEPEASSDKVRILVVDDHPIVRRAITQMLSGKPDIEVCGEAGDALQALEAVERLAPTLAIVDIGLNGRNGLELIKDLKARWPAVKVLVMSVHDESHYAERALHAGAQGYVSKEARPRVIEDAIRQVAMGRVFLSETAAAGIINRVAGLKSAEGQSALDVLSDRETEVFELLGQGYGTREIAERFHLSPKTIASHLQNMKRKLKMASTRELIRFAMAYNQDRH